MIGDFNCPTINWQTDDGGGVFERKLVDCLNDNFLEQVIDEPTRYRNGQNPSLLDLIITSEPGIVGGLEIREPFGKCDHCRILFDLSNEKIVETDKNFCQYDKMDQEKFRSIIRDNNWDLILTSSNVDDVYDSFLKIVQEATTECTPVAKRTNKRKAPWATKLTKKLSRKKKEKWNKYKRTKLENDYNDYKDTLNNFNDEKTKAIMNFENNVIAQKNTRPKLYYSYVARKSKYISNEICLKQGDNVEVDDRRCAEILNEYFGSVFTKGDSELPEFRLQRPVPEMPEIIFVEELVLKKLRGLDTRKACGPDNVPSCVLKENAEILAPILCQIFTKSYADGRVPIQMKRANVVPLFKGGDRSFPNNFRPVSLTPIISKLFESIVHDKMRDHIESNNMMSQYQHGFRKNHSTNTNLIYFRDEISSLANARWKRNIYHIHRPKESF